VAVHGASAGMFMSPMKPNRVSVRWRSVAFDRVLLASQELCVRR
jgi:hypothetical protein